MDDVNIYVRRKVLFRLWKQVSCELIVKERHTLSVIKCL